MPVLTYQHSILQLPTLADVEALVREGSFDGITITVSGEQARDLGQHDLVDVLTKAQDAAERYLVALVAAGIRPCELDVAVGIFNDRVSANAMYDGSPRSRPILVIDENGRGRWCGGPIEIRSLFNELSTEPRCDNGRDVSTYPQITNTLKRYPQFLRSDGSSLRMCITPELVLTQLERAVAVYFVEAVKLGGPGVRRGNYRSPSLRLVERWVDVKELLQQSVGTAIAGLLLARALKHRSGVELSHQVRVVRVGTFASGLSQALIRSADLYQHEFVLADEFDGPTPADRMPAGTPVILCGDVLSTGNSMIRAITEILQWRAIPLAVVTPIDARIRDESFDALGSTVPVARLVHVNLSATIAQSDTVLDIDPILRAPVPRAPVQNVYTWPPHDFLSACTLSAGIVGFAHVDRPTHGHFTLYFDPGGVISRNSPIREETAGRMVDAILDLFREMNIGSLPSAPTEIAPISHRDSAGIENRYDRIIVAHPGPIDDHSSEFAQAIVNGLRSKLAKPVINGPVTIPREVAGSRFAFPNALEQFSSNSCIVLVDWGALEAATITQLIRLVAEAGASHILAIVLVSQMRSHEERALTMLRAVSGSPTQVREHDSQPDVASSMRKTTEIDIPVRVKFLTALPNSSTPRNDCPLCRLSSELQDDVDNARLPRELLLHAAELATILRPASRDECIRRGTDAFGLRQQPTDAIRYTRLRSLLMAALRSTSTRQRVVDTLDDMVHSDGVTVKGAAVRLFAAERQWLKLPPLRFPQCVASVARVSFDVAIDHKASARLRLQAILVLAESAPLVFVESLPDLWRPCLGTRELVLHIIYQLYRLIRRLPGVSSEPLRNLRKSVAQCRRMTRQNGTMTVLNSHDPEWLLTSVLFAIDRACVDRRLLDSRQACAALHERYLFRLQNHCEAEGALTRLLLQMEDVPTTKYALDGWSWRVTWRSWKTVEYFLQSNLLPFLPALEPLLSGPFGEEYFNVSTRSRLELLASPNYAVRDLTELAKDIYLLRGDGATDSPPRGAWQRISEHLEIIHRSVLAVGSADLERAELATFLDQCPANLLDTLSDCVAEAKRRQFPVRIAIITDHIAELYVFCHEEVLRSVIMHLIENAATSKHRSPELVGITARLEIAVKVGADDVVIRLRNDKTRSSSPPGRGLSSSRRQVEAFGGRLTPRSPEPSWTYEVELKFLPAVD